MSPNDGRLRKQRWTPKRKPINLRRPERSKQPTGSPVLEQVARTTEMDIKHKNTGIWTYFLSRPWLRIKFWFPNISWSDRRFGRCWFASIEKESPKLRIIMKRFHRRANLIKQMFMHKHALSRTVFSAGKLSRKSSDSRAWPKRPLGRPKLAKSLGARLASPNLTDFSFCTLTQLTLRSNEQCLRWNSWASKLHRALYCIENFPAQKNSRPLLSNRPIAVGDSLVFWTFRRSKIQILESKKDFSWP